MVAVVVGLLAACSSSEPKGRHITIAVASNMQVAMEELSRKFSQIHGIEVQVASGSSGVLTAQVRQGAPFDVFVSANMRYPKALQNEGFTSGVPKIYAHGTLILWSLTLNDLSQGLKILKSSSVEHFAVANPEIAPYGIAGMQALRNAGVLDQLRSKMVIGESIGQVNQYVSSGAVQVGLTSGSVQFSSTLIDKGYRHEIEPSLYQPIEQGVVILKNGQEENLETSELFFHFMFSADAREVLNAYGYRALETK